MSPSSRTGEQQQPALPQSQPDAPPSPQRSLARALARRCRGRTLVLGSAFAALRERLDAGGVALEVHAADTPRQADEPTFDTVLLLDALEHVAPEQAPALLQRAFAWVGARGQLLVCVPNAHAPAASARQQFERPALKRLLERIDQPRVYTDQPYAWLLMGIEREPVLDHAAAERCSAIAALCRGRVLELGCGPGHLTAEIARRGLPVVGVDLSARKIERARARHPGLEFHRQDILAMPLDTRYDTVVLPEVLEHVPADVGDRMLDRAWSLVAPGGQLVVSVPNEDCVPHRNHVREFTAASLRALLARFGPPATETTQPFKWLVMRVAKPASGA